MAEEKKTADKPYRGMRQWLETEIWPQIPDELLDRKPMSKDEIEDILGIGPEGYCSSGGDFAKTDLVSALSFR